MATLNVDCWRVVFDHLEPETRALYHCLFVSKEFFTFSSRVLYCRPLKVFEDQREFSPFSRHRLGNLLDICSGFTAVREEQQQQTSSSPSPLSSSSSPLSSSSSTTTKPASSSSSLPSSKHPLHDFKPPLAIIPETGPSITLPTTINYFNLVTEYPNMITANSQSQDFISCYAETIPVLEVEIQCFNIILPMVSRFRVLNSLIIYAPEPSPLAQPSPSTSSQSTLSSTSLSSSLAKPDTLNDSINYLGNIQQFIHSHQTLFPGRLKSFQTDCRSGGRGGWKEFFKIQKAMGGVSQQWIAMDQNFQQDLDELIVSRLKILKLTCHVFLSSRTHPRFEMIIMKLLKRCHGLESLELGCPKNVVLDWSLLFQETIDSRMGLEDEIDGLLFQPHLLVQQQQTQLQQPRRQGFQSIFELKHLVVLGNTTVALQVMEVFRNTLETIKIAWQGGNSREQHLSRMEVVDWKSSFVLPNLNSIELDHVSFSIDNLSCCPVLKTLILTRKPKYHGQPVLKNIWPNAPVRVSVNLRTLQLTDYGIEILDFLAIKDLVNLEILQLLGTFLDAGDTSEHNSGNSHYSNSDNDNNKYVLIHLSENDWCFPKLRSVKLSGIFAAKIQGQILWVAPKLESFALDLRLCYSPKAFRPDTFLYPPSALNLETRTLLSSSSTIGISTVSFPILKHFVLLSYHFERDPNQDQFAEAFFGQRQDPTITTTVIKDGEGESGNKCNNSDVERVFDNNWCFDDDNSFLFPNLEEIEFYMLHPLNYLEQYVVEPMRNLPKLNRVWCWGIIDPLEYRDQVTKWLQEVPQDRLGKRHVNYRHRPMAPTTENTTKTTTAVGSNQMVDNTNRCLAEFGLNGNARYQLKASISCKSSTMNRVKARKSKLFKQMFSW